MTRKRLFTLVIIGAIVFSCTIVYASSNAASYSFSQAEVSVNDSVSFVYGPYTISDKYWGSASISGRDVDAASVQVKGWTEKTDNIINTTLNYNKKAVSVSKVSCGYGQSWGKIKVTFEGKGRTIKATDKK